MILVDKQYTETPLEALERAREAFEIDESISMTYAGRLDPLATGLLILLVGDEVYQKDEFLELEKIYEVQICFGLKTDTGDILGLIKNFDNEQNLPENGLMISEIETVKRFAYPDYSSKTVKGEPLFQLVKKGKIIEKPEREVSYEIIDFEESELKIERLIELHKKSLEVNGDFRQEEIKKSWDNYLNKNSVQSYKVFNLSIKVSSGTYIRSIPEILEREFGLLSVITKIHRIGIGEFLLDDCEL